MTDDLAFIDATGQADLVRRGEVGPAELVEAAIERIEKVDPELNSVITPLFDKAREVAAGDVPEGPFRGVPFVLKDLAACSAGDPFHEGMAFLKRLGWVAERDTYLVERFRAAGFVIVGKTNTPELGILPTTEPDAYGPTRNPWDTGRTTGGSSGGSAAAVAAGLVPAGHANDGGGSIRIPASACGLVGLKPTRGRVSAGPDVGDVMGGLTVELAVTRSVRDTATILDAVHGTAVGDPYVAPPPARPYAQELGADPGRLRIGVRTAAFAGITTTHPDCVAAADDAGRLLESLGHDVEPADLPALDDTDYLTHFITSWSAGTAWNLDEWSQATGQTIVADDVEPLTWALAEAGRAVGAPQWLTSRAWLQGHARRVQAWWNGGFDLLLTPTLGEPPPPLGQFAGPPDNPLHGLFRAGEFVPFTPLFNVTGQPAISLPLHWNHAGLPIGVQLVAAFGREDVLLRVAAQLEAARPWADRVPPVHA